MSSSNMLRRGADLLSSKRHAHMTETVIYRRGTDYVIIQATVGTSQSLDQSISDFIVDTDRIDFVVRAADLVILAAQITPQEGDVIEYNNGSGGILYPLRRDEGEQIFQMVSEHGGDLRIHTKRKGPA